MSYLSLDKSTLMGYISNSFTYLIVLLQFKVGMQLETCGYFSGGEAKNSTSGNATMENSSSINSSLTI